MQQRQRRMYSLGTFTQHPLGPRVLTAWCVLFLFAETAATAQSLSALGSPVHGAAGAAANELETRRLLALDAAVIAARGKLFDLSVDATQRALEQPVVVAKPDFQSSLLGGRSTNSTTISNPPTVTGESPGQIAVRQKLELLVDVWKEMEAPPEKIAAVLQQIVLPGGEGQTLQMFAPRSSDSMNRSFNFNLTTPTTKLPRALGFDAVEWAHAAGQLDSLIAALEKRVDEPASQLAATAMLIYAQRVADRPEAAAKSLEKLLEKLSQPKGESNLVINALTRPLPERVQAKTMEESMIADFALRILASNPDSEEVRSFVMQRLALAIKQGDRESATRYVEAIEASIDRLSFNNPQFQAQLKAGFLANVERECIQQNMADMAVDFVVRHFATGQDHSRYVGSYESRVLVLAKGSSAQRMERGRRVLLTSPLTDPAQLGFATPTSLSSPPEFFGYRDELEELLPLLKPFENANTISVLDTLLNEAETLGQTKEVVDQLLKNASDREDITKLIAQWMMLRAEKRGTQLDETIAALGRFATEQDFINWVKRMPHAAAVELISQHTAKEPLSDALVELLETHATSSTIGRSSFTGIEGFAEKYYRRRFPLAAPLRSSTDLKHWCVSSNRAALKRTSPRMVLNVPSTAGQQGLGHRSGALMLRYPLKGDMTIQGTVKSSALESTTLGLNGIAVRLSNTANISWGQRSYDSQKPIPLEDSNTIAWNQEGDTLSLSVNGELKRKWRQTASGFPFISLSSDSLCGDVPTDLTVTGRFEIPREVELIDQALTGWSSIFYHPLPPTAGAFEEIQVGPSSNNSGSRVIQSSALVWRVQEGEIVVGQRPDDKAREATPKTNDGSGESISQTRQTAIHYDRPLLEGERVDFELYHNAMAQTVMPVLGQVSYCLDSDHVTLRWIASATEQKRFQIAEDDRADDPAGKQLAPVQLEDNAWNRVALRIEAGNVILSIADQDVYRRPLTGNESSLFGFVANPNAPEARIRNVVLKGDWPTELPKDLWELAD